MPCARTQHLVLAGIELTIIWAINSADDKFVIFFYYQENRIWHFMQWRQFAWNANPVFLEEWEKYFKMSPVENFTQSAKRYGLHEQITHESVHGKTYDKTCTKRRISLHTLILHISSLIRAFANRMCLLQSLGLAKRLVRRAKTWVCLRNCKFW